MTDREAAVSRVLPPRRVEVELVQRAMTTGRNRPLLVYVRDEESDAALCVIKPTGRLTWPPAEYLFEWVGAALARALGLFVPESLAVSVPVELASAANPEFRNDLLSSKGLVYGAEFVAQPFTQLAFDYALSAEQREQAARILAFDVFIHNPDRRPDNANLFVKRNGFVIFDHEAAFDFLLPILGGHADPALDPCSAIVQRHLFYSRLRGKCPPLNHFGADLNSLDDGFFAALREATPPEWTEGAAHGKLDKILEVLQKRRDAVDDWLPEVSVCLDR